MKSGFKCLNCQRYVLGDKNIGSAHRNHCPFCLWSKHVDLAVAGDRKSACQEGMEPIGLAFKKEKPDKYRPGEKGELMLVHYCTGCEKISLNRIAADDEPTVIFRLLSLKTRIDQAGIDFLDESNRPQVENQLYGRR